MKDPDAYLDEMAKILGAQDEELDGVYAGSAPTESLAEVASFMLEVRSTLSGGPSDDIAGAHVAAMVVESKKVPTTRPLSATQEAPAGPTRWRKVMDRTISTALKGAAGLLAASMSMMGLAYAGVDLPGQAAAQALESVTGVELPNQDGHEGSVAEDVKAVIESDLETGCEFGQAVAAAASQNAEAEPGEENDPCSKGEKGKATGEERSAAGRATASEKSAAGRATATERSEGAADAGDGNAGTGSERAAAGAGNAGSEGSTADDDTSDDAAGGASGRSTASEHSGGASDGGAGNSDRRP